jgi:hypothetical protein
MGRKKVDLEKKRIAVNVYLPREMVNRLELIATERALSIAKVIEICLTSGEDVESLELGYGYPEDFLEANTEKVELSREDYDAYCKVMQLMPNDDLALATQESYEDFIKRTKTNF